jgi:hypothetical protein
VVWARAEHVEGGIRLVLSDPSGPDADLSLRTVRAEELGRALFHGGSAYGISASAVDGEATAVRVAVNEITVTIEGDAPRVFALEADQACELGASILSRPVSYEVECSACGTRTWSETRIAPSEAIAETRATTESWTCPKCAASVPKGRLGGYGDDVWRVP